MDAAASKQEKPKSEGGLLSFFGIDQLVNSMISVPTEVVAQAANVGAEVINQFGKTAWDTGKTVVESILPKKLKSKPVTSQSNTPQMPL